MNMNCERIKLGVTGANGRMGRAVIEAIAATDQATLGGAQVRKKSTLLGCDAGELCAVGTMGVSLTEQLCSNNIDVVIDFSLPECFEQNLNWCLEHGKALVVGTTGLSEEQHQLMRAAASVIPIVWAANMSVGVNVLLNLVKLATKVLGDDADIEIIETHHRNKVDAPSGTAMAIGETIANTRDIKLSDHAIYGREGNTGVREADTIGFSTIRGGDVVGDHTVLFAVQGERLELTHKSSSRQTYANGAIKASHWLIGKKPGLYSMQQVLALTE